MSSSANQTLKADQPSTASFNDHHTESAWVVSRVAHGIDAKAVRIEAHVSNGLHKINIIGLPEKSIKESKERVRSALINSGFRVPDRRITVNLAPAHLPKYGSHLDLAIALSILIASKQIHNRNPHIEYYGELALSGALRPIPHAVTHALACHQHQRSIALPHNNRFEAALVSGLKVYGCQHLLEACELMQNQPTIQVTQAKAIAAKKIPDDWPSLDEVKGQSLAKRALVIACAGGHNLIMRGPPGTGKTLLAQCARRLQSPLTPKEQQTVMRIHASRSASAWITERPFRQPHHSATMAAMIGGGQPITVGETSLAHHGILLLDEIAEFKASVLDSLREPLESGVVHFARAGVSMQWPARFQLLATCNPCPCGHYTPHTSCHCTTTQIQRYQARLSGPMWDRMDMGVEISAQSRDESSEWTQATSYQAILRAQQRQQERQGALNAMLPVRASQQLAIEADAEKYIERAAKNLSLSMRAKQRALRVARTIADLDEQTIIHTKHIQEALALRPMRNGAVGPI